MSGRRVRKFVVGIGWVKPKKGWVWTIKGNNVRRSPLPAWGSRKWPEESMAESSIDP